MGFSRQEYWSGVPLQASGLTEFIPCLFTSAICGQACFLVHLASCTPPAPQQAPWGMAASPGWKFWEPSFKFGGQKSLMAVTFLVYQYSRRYFHFTGLFVYPFPSAFTCAGLMTLLLSFPFYPLPLILPQMAPSHFYISHAGPPVLSHLH